MISIADSRPNYIDYAKVFAIFCVVLGHYTYALDFFYEPSQIWNVMHIITLFHMPFFFIVSGLLYKKIGTKDTISKGWIQLLKPYLIMSVLVSVIMIMVMPLELMSLRNFDDAPRYWPFEALADWPSRAVMLWSPKVLV